MSREIKFRGNSLVTKEQVFGHLFYFDDGRYFISPKGTTVEGDEGEYPSEYYLRGVKCIEVEPGTVNRYTGLKDMNGVEIYEGDFVRVTLRNYESFVSYVKWFGDEGYPSFDLHQVNEAFYFDSNILSTVMNDGSEVEVIGNIYENKNLLKEDTR